MDDPVAGQNVILLNTGSNAVSTRVRHHLGRNKCQIIYFIDAYLYNLVFEDLGGNLALHVSPSGVVGVPADTLGKSSDR